MRAIDYVLEKCAALVDDTDITKEANQFLKSMAVKWSGAMAHGNQTHPISIQPAKRLVAKAMGAYKGEPLKLFKRDATSGTKKISKSLKSLRGVVEDIRNAR